MKTEIISETPIATGGRAILTERIDIRSARLHNLMEEMTYMNIFLIESDSNETQTLVDPADVLRLRDQWKHILWEFDFETKEENNSLPRGSHQLAFKIEIVQSKQIRQIQNKKCRKVASAVWQTQMMIAGTQTSKLQGFVDPETQKTIRKMFDYVDRVLEAWMGGGTSPADTGVVMPEFPEIGEVIPPVNAEFVERLEPSSASARPAIPDYPDTPPVSKM